MGPPPSIAVLITNRNDARYVGEAIDPVLCRVPAPVPVVVVDDASTDDSASVLAGDGDRVALVRPGGVGQGGAVTAGLPHRDADVVICLDADDRLLPRALARVGRAFAVRPRPVRVHYPLRVIDADGRPTGETRPHPPLRLPAGDLAPGTLASPFDAPRAGMSGDAFARATLEPLMPVPDRFADGYPVHASSLYGPVGAVGDALGEYRVHGANAYGAGDGSLDLTACAPRSPWRRAPGGTSAATPWAWACRAASPGWRR